MTFQDLPSDIVDRILVLISDFETLSVALRSSKIIYDVYSVHPNSIFRAIAYNVTGPSLPQALCVANMQRRDSRAVDNVQDLFVNEVDAVEKLLCRKNAKVLVSNVRVVSHLEDIFSWRYKDRHHPRSTLSHAESERFYRAIYRVWVLTLLENRMLDTDEPTCDYIIESLKRLSDEEVLEIDRVHEFLQDLSSWTFVAVMETPTVRRLNASPDRVLEAYQTSEPAVFDYWTDNTRCLDDALTDTLSSKRNLNENKRKERRNNVILGSIVGETDSCHRCDAVKGLQLWGPTNWHFLKGILCDSLSNLLPGYLSNNPFQTPDFSHHIRERPFSNIIEECFDLDVDDDGDWDKTQWYCLDCIRLFLKKRLWRWWLKQKEQDAGYEAKPDCWYGYNCRTQTHRQRHAQNLNHLCKPTRGDPHPDDVVVAT